MMMMFAMVMVLFCLVAAAASKGSSMIPEVSLASMAFRADALSRSLIEKMSCSPSTSRPRKYKKPEDCKYKGNRSNRHGDIEPVDESSTSSLESKAPSAHEEEPVDEAKPVLPLIQAMKGPIILRFIDFLDNVLYLASECFDITVMRKAGYFFVRMGRCCDGICHNIAAIFPEGHDCIKISEYYADDDDHCDDFDNSYIATPFAACVHDEHAKAVFAQIQMLSLSWNEICARLEKHNQGRTAMLQGIIDAQNEIAALQRKIQQLERDLHCIGPETAHTLAGEFGTLYDMSQVPMDRIEGFRYGSLPKCADIHCWVFGPNESVEEVEKLMEVIDK